MSKEQMPLSGEASDEKHSDVIGLEKPEIFVGPNGEKNTIYKSGLYEDEGRERSLEIKTANYIDTLRYHSRLEILNKVRDEIKETEKLPAGEIIQEIQSGGQSSWSREDQLEMLRRAEKELNKDLEDYRATHRQI